MTKDEIIQDAIECLDDIVKECEQIKRREPYLYNDFVINIEQGTRGHVKRLQRIAKEEREATIRDAFGIQQEIDMKKETKNMFKSMGVSLLYMLSYIVPYAAGWFTYPFDQKGSAKIGNLIFFIGFLLYSVIIYYYIKLNGKDN